MVLINQTSIIVFGIVAFTDLTLDIDNPGHDDGNCRLKGILSVTHNQLFSSLRKHGIGCHVLKKDSFGVAKNGSYDGLLGDVITGSIDVVAMPVYYPLRNGTESILYSTPLSGDQVTILSAYFVPNETTTGDLLDMISMVPSMLWIGYLFSFILFLVVTRIGCKLLSIKFDTLWMTICAFLGQDNLPMGSLFLNVLSTFCMLGIFFKMTYVKNSMSTDLVTYDPPIVINKYQDVLDRNVTTYFGDIIPEYQTFKDEPMDIMERKLTEKSYLEKADQVIGHVVDIGKAYLNQTMCAIARPYVTWMAALAFMVNPTFPSEAQFFLGSDPVAKSYTNVMVYNSRLHGSPAVTIMDKMIRRMNQNGLTRQAWEQSYVDMIELQFGTTVRPSQLLRISPHVKQGSTDEIVAINGEHVKRVFILMAASVSVSFIVLLVELLAGKMFASNKRAVVKVRAGSHIEVRKVVVITVNVRRCASAHQ